MNEGSHVVVPISKPSFQGEWERIALLGSTLDHATLQGLIRGGQICVSIDGRTIARSVADNDGTHRVFLGDTILPSLVFTDVPQMVSVDADGVLVLGKTLEEVGLFRGTRFGCTRVGKGTELLGVQRSTAGMLVFTRSPGDNDRRNLFVEAFGQELSVHAQGTVRGLKNNDILIVEPIGERVHRYVVGVDGFRDVSVIPLAGEEHLVGVVAFKKRYLLGLRSSHLSTLRVIGLPSVSTLERNFPIEGSLELLWQSPSGETFAYLTRLKQRSQDVRRLVVGRETIHEGQFSMEPRDLVWSQNGQVAGARVKEGITGNGPTQLICHSDRMEIHPDRTVEEFVIDDEGHVAARIETDGRYHFPFVGLARHSAQQFAWNLTISQNGVVKYNSVVADHVCLTVDRTNSRSRTAHG